VGFILKKKRPNLDGIFDDGAPTPRRRARRYDYYSWRTRKALSVEGLEMLVPDAPKPKGKPGPKSGYVPSPEDVARVVAELRRRRGLPVAAGPGGRGCA
jgi:hypothetical protein